MIARPHYWKPHGGPNSHDGDFCWLCGVDASAPPALDPCPGPLVRVMIGRRSPYARGYTVVRWEGRDDHGDPFFARFPSRRWTLAEGCNCLVSDLTGQVLRPCSAHRPRLSPVLPEEPDHA